MPRRDAVAAAAILLLAAAVVREAGRLPFGSARSPGEGFVPWWLGVILGVLALILLLRSLLERRAAGAPQPRRTGRPLAVLLALAAYAVAVDPLGYPLCTFLLVVVTLAPRSPREALPALALALATAGGSYVLFAVWLGVPLPAGPLAR